jgi:hypothetical protein
VLQREIVPGCLASQPVPKILLFSVPQGDDGEVGPRGLPGEPVSPPMGGILGLVSREMGP